MQSVAIACAVIVLGFVGIGWTQGNGAELFIHPGGFDCDFGSTTMP
jgi:hypothetical protein